MNILVSLLAKNRDSIQPGGEQTERPSVQLSCLPDLHFDKYYIMGNTAMFKDSGTIAGNLDGQKTGDEKYKELHDQITKAIQELSNDTELIWKELELIDPWDLEKVFNAFKNWSDEIWKDICDENDVNIFVHTSSGTHIEQISLFLLVESGHLPGKIIQTLLGGYRIIDLNDEKFQPVINRFIKEPTDVVNQLKDGIQTEDKAYNAMIDRIARVARKSNEPILLMGPTGAGKSKLAGLIYKQKIDQKKVTGQFVQLNCATLEPALAGSTLFGHKKGAFTGASDDHVGILKEADGGILFLDEIGELKPDIQAKLLTAIESKSFVPVGGTYDEKEESNFQLICGTNRDLREEIADGTFRRDLFERINMWSFRLPGLAERPEDIEPNLDKELFDLKKGMSKEARKQFLNFATQYAWPGNFREFHKILSRAAALSESPKIDLTTIQEEIDFLRQEKIELYQGKKSTSQEKAFDPDAGLKQLLGDQYTKLNPLERVELRYITEICLQSNSISDAGRKLYGQSSNDAQRLSRYLKNLGITFADLKELQK